MGLVNTVVGAVVLTVIIGTWLGAMSLFEIFRVKFGGENIAYVCLVVLAIFLSYLLGGGIHDYRKQNKKA